jgi:hypothetical protein
MHILKRTVESLTSRANSCATGLDPLVGQTLWNHIAGIDKDVRAMLLDSEAEICVYVARDTLKARRLLSEAMKDFRTRGVLVAPTGFVSSGYLKTSTPMTKPNASSLQKCCTIM